MGSVARTDGVLRKASIIMALIGLVDSLYLAYIKLSNQIGICGIGECEVVNSSKYAEVAGIPIALLGAGAYLLIAVLLGWGHHLNPLGQSASLWVFGITLVGVLYSIYLTYIEVAVLHAICPYCVVSAVVMAFLFVLAIVRLFMEPVAEE